MRTRIPALAVGVVFGVTLSWTGLSSPNVIRDALLFKSAYLFLFFGSALATAFVGLRILRARRERALLVDRPVDWKVQSPQRHHIVGGMLFGTGWAIADACPARSRPSSARASGGACSRSPASSRASRSPCAAGGRPPG